jgi:hypothetical protein
MAGWLSREIITSRSTPKFRIPNNDAYKNIVGDRLFNIKLHQQHVCAPRMEYNLRA